MKEIKLTIIIPVYNQEELVIRALDSIPYDDRIEIIAIDDASIDNTLSALREYQQNTSKNIAVLYNLTNMGVGFTVNKGINEAKGEYIVLLGSDDYFIEMPIDELDGTDLIYFDLEINDGSHMYVNEKTKHGYCGSTKFMRREFVGKTREPNIRQGEDYWFYKELLKKNPSEKFLHRAIKHYNYPRENSLTWKAIHG